MEHRPAGEKAGAVPERPALISFAKYTMAGFGKTPERVVCEKTGTVYQDRSFWMGIGLWLISFLGGFALYLWLSIGDVFDKMLVPMNYADEKMIMTYSSLFGICFIWLGIFAAPLLRLASYRLASFRVETQSHMIESAMEQRRKLKRTLVVVWIMVLVLGGGLVGGELYVLLGEMPAAFADRLMPVSVAVAVAFVLLVAADIVIAIYLWRHERRLTRENPDIWGTEAQEEELTDGA